MRTYSLSRISLTGRTTSRPSASVQVSPEPSPRSPCRRGMRERVLIRPSFGCRMMKVKEKIKHKMFVTFEDVKRDVQSVVDGKRTVADVLADEE